VLDYVGVNGGHIVHSDFHDGPGVIIMLKGGTSDLLFAWNRVHGQTAPGDALTLGQSTGPQFFQPIDPAFEGLRIVAYANLLYDLVGPPVAFTGCKDCAVVRNTIWNTTGNQLVRFLPGEAGMNSGVMKSIPEGNRFTGNIVVGGQEGGASLNADEHPARRRQGPTRPRRPALRRCILERRGRRMRPATARYRGVRRALSARRRPRGLRLAPPATRPINTGP